MIGMSRAIAQIVEHIAEPGDDLHELARAAELYLRDELAKELQPA